MNEVPNGNEEIELYKQQIEEEFFQAVESGENLYVYLYVPHMLLSERVKTKLDEFLIEEAYKNLFVLKNKDTVYDDGFRVTTLKDDPDFKRDFFSRMIEFYTAKEDYTKCSEIKTAYGEYL